MATIKIEYILDKKDEILTPLTFADIREGTIFRTQYGTPCIKTLKNSSFLPEAVNLVTGKLEVIDSNTEVSAYVDTLKMSEDAFKKYKEQVELYDKRILLKNN